MEKEDWTYIIKSKTSLFDINFTQLWKYKDLIFLFVKRDFTTAYKQTILGPIWHFLQPLFSSFIFAFVFSFMAKVKTPDGIPPVLFYLSGIVPWNFFSECANKNSNVFRSNSNIFGKVFFPRLSVPVSTVISSFLRFIIQIFLFFLIFFFFYFQKKVIINVNSNLIFFPALIVIMACLGLGIGLIVSSITVRYRDLANLVTFGIQILMYLSPVIFPLSMWQGKNVKWVESIVMANPMTAVIEMFRNGFLGIGTCSAFALIYSSVFALIVLLTGLLLFNKTEKRFIDIV